MTDINGIARGRSASPRDIRTATFTQRRRGLDPDEVRDFLHQLADQVQAAADERAALVAEIERLRSARPSSEGGAEANTQAVTLLSQAQLVADRLVAEHEQRSRHLLSSARSRQREMLQRQPGGSGGAADPARGYVVPVPDIEYVRTYTRIAQSQLRTVLTALAEQVDKLGELPQLENARESPQQVWNR